MKYHLLEKKRSLNINRILTCVQTAFLFNWMTFVCLKRKKNIKRKALNVRFCVVSTPAVKIWDNLNENWWGYLMMKWFNFNETPIASEMDSIFWNTVSISLSIYLWTNHCINLFVLNHKRAQILVARRAG